MNIYYYTLTFSIQATPVLQQQKLNSVIVDIMEIEQNCSSFAIIYYTTLHNLG